jgi:lysophospholipid acyltransferase 1/2
MLPPSSVHMLVHNIIIIIIVIIMIVSYSLIYALTGVGMGHIYRMYIDYGGYSLDFTGPLMMLVQRVSYVASSYHDGKLNLIK